MRTFFLKRIIFFFFLLPTLFACRQPKGSSSASEETNSQFDTTFLNYNQGKFFPNITFERFGVENGLPSGFIIRLVQDHQGFLWIATDNGLCRYDGRIFKVWQNEFGDTTSLPSNQINDLAVDARGNLWLFLIGKGICCFNPDDETFQLYGDTLHKLNEINNFHKICIDKKGRIWLNAGYFDTQTRRFVSVEGYGQYDRTVTRDTDTSVFCLNNQHVLSKFEETSQRFKVVNTIANMEKASLSSIRIDRQGNFWAGSQTGHLYKFMPGVDTVVEDYFADRTKPPQNSFGGTITDIWYSQSTDLLWIAQWGGLLRFDMKAGGDPKIFRYRYDENNEFSLPDRVASCVLEDRSGVMWVGTVSGGLVKFAPAKQRFQVYRKVPGDTSSLSNGNITAVFQDSKRRTWVGTKKGLNLIDRNTGKVRSFITPREVAIGCNPEWVTGIAEDPASGKLMILYWGAGFNWFDPETKKFSRPVIRNAKLPMPECWMFLTKSIFYATDTVLLFEWGRALSIYNLKTGVLSGATRFEKSGRPLDVALALCALVDHKKNIWIGMDQEKGLFRTRLAGADTINWVQVFNDKNSSFTLAYHHLYLSNVLNPSRLASGTVTTVFEDSKNRIWLGTANGLYLLEDPEKGIFRRYGKRQGFADASIAGILEDDHGMLWVSTNAGISRFNPVEGIVENNYNYTDGLPGNQFNMGACFKNEQGEMLFGSTKGLAVFHPDSLGSNRYAPPIAFTKIVADGKDIRIPSNTNEVEIPSLIENLQIEFTALDFTRPELNRFRYQLEGLDQNMSPVSMEPKAVFTNLPPGEYNFHVQASNNDDYWNKAGTSLILRVVPEWYEILWVQLSALLLAVVYLFLFVKWRERRIVRKEQKRGIQLKSLQVQVHQAQMNPHFIFNVLSAIKSLLVVSKKPEQAGEYLDKFSILMRRYLESSVKGDISKLSVEQNEISLANEIELIDMYVACEQLAYQEKFEYELFVEPGLDVGNESLQPMLIQPYVENAIKNGLLNLPRGQKGFLKVSFWRNDLDALICVVEDSGVGRKEAALLQAQSVKRYESQGGKLTQARVEMLNQLGYDIQINTSDREGGGTIVEIIVS